MGDGMTAFLYHERLHRGDALLARLRDLPITVCGAGALGANIVENLARQGAGRLTVIDRDRVEERNLSTQPYYRSDIGAFKAKILGNSLFRALGVTVTTQSVELAAGNAARLLAGAALVIDTFDNSVARAAVSSACVSSGTSCLHTGLSGDGFAEVAWDDVYTIPSDTGDDLCDYPLARNLALLVVAVAAETIVRWADTGEKVSRTVTLADMAVRERPG